MVRQQFIFAAVSMIFLANTILPLHKRQQAPQATHIMQMREKAELYKGAAATIQLVTMAAGSVLATQFGASYAQSICSDPHSDYMQQHHPNIFLAFICCGLIEWSCFGAMCGWRLSEPLVRKFNSHARRYMQQAGVQEHSIEAVD